ncbi:MAG: CDP-glycerol glycerophosphotransferase family protein, partial [Clostridium neonatale]
LQDFQKYNLISTNNILFLTQNDIENKKINLYSLFNETDALLTDYSSVNFDYLLLNKPIGYVIDDFENYKNRPGFAMKNPLDVMPGDKLYSVKDLYRFIETLLKGEDNYRESREKVNEWANKYHDNKNCERLLKIIKKFYKDF